MKVFQSIDSATGLEGTALALGNFDGVHLGHQALFAEAKRRARPAALTFNPHPGKILQPLLAPKLITTMGRKLELFEEQQLDAVVVQPFTTHYAKTSAADFEASLFDLLKVAHVVVGGDFTYGEARKGSVETLERAAAARGAQVGVVAPVAVGGVIVSSTKIREYILEGRVSAARQMLGRHFDIDGLVVPGQGRGRTIGIPTANVDTENELKPAPGVYAVRAQKLEQGKRSHDWLPGAANIGVKPTFGGTQATIEVHLIDFSGDLYGATLRVQFLERLRSERRFGSVGELTAQIRRDIEEARAVTARADV
jgi:riboflavin kinase / FMN adenylyltransferase